MISNNNGRNRSIIETSSGVQEEKWDRIVVQRKTFSSHSKETVRNGVKQRLSAYYSSESESEEEDHQQNVSRFNGTLSRLSHFSETDDEGEAEPGMIRGFGHKVWTMARRVTSSLGFCFYWGLVNIFVCEKWILNRKPGGPDSPFFIPAHRCSSVALRPIRRGSGGSPSTSAQVRRSVPWPRIPITYLLLPLLAATGIYFAATRTNFPEFSFFKQQESVTDFVKESSADFTKEPSVSVIKEVVKDCTIVCPPPPALPVQTQCGMSGAEVEMMIRAAIAQYDADKTGKPDLALESAGGSVVSTRCTKKSNYVGSQVLIWNIPIWYPSNNPRKAIQPGAMPGDCWSFDGSEGFLVIKVVGPTRVTGFTMEHLAKTISPHGHIQSAPKRFQVVGHLDYNDPENEFIFGDYEYLDNDNPIQYFEVQNPSDTFFPYVELKILSNHGSIAFTCLYRFRVHGYLETWALPKE